MYFIINIERFILHIQYEEILTLFPSVEIIYKLDRFYIKKFNAFNLALFLLF